MTDTKKAILLQGAKTGVLALVFSVIGVLLLALFAKLFGLSGSVLPIVNQILKIVAVVIAMLLFVRDEKFIAKGFVATLVFCLLSLLVFSILGGQFHLGQVLLDLAITLAVASVVAFAKAKRA